MLSSTGTKQNTVGYFTYPTDQKPTDISQVTPIIAYPRISTAVCNSSSTAGSMYTGDRVELKYWDGTKFVNEFCGSKHSMVSYWVFLQPRHKGDYE